MIGRFATDEIIDLVLLYARVHKSFSVGMTDEEVLSEFFIQVGKYIKRHQQVDKFFIGSKPNKQYMFLTVKNIIRKSYRKEKRYFDTNKVPAFRAYQSDLIEDCKYFLFD